VKLEILETFDQEICHYGSRDLLVTSRHYHVYWVERGKEKIDVPLPKTYKDRIFGPSRLFRRALRLDKCNVVPVIGGFVAIRQGRVYHYEEKAGMLRCVLKLKNCRNVLTQSIAVVDRERLYFGEYGSNDSRRPVPVYRSVDGGKSWEMIYSFPAGTVKHVHGCYHDPHERKIWVLTGDFANECVVICADETFRDMERIGA